MNHQNILWQKKTSKLGQILIKHFGPFPDLVGRGGGEVVGDGSLNFPAGSRKLEIENQF